MNNTNTITFSDYFFEIGNQFFNLKIDECNSIKDDLLYERQEKEGINGYMLKIEEQADDYSNIFMKMAFLIFDLIKSLFIKSNKVIPSAKKNKIQAHREFKQGLDYKVGQRLLDVINEDADLWREQVKRKQGLKNRKNSIRKNQFKVTHRE